MKSESIELQSLCENYLEVSQDKAKKQISSLNENKIGRMNLNYSKRVGTVLFETYTKLVFKFYVRLKFTGQENIPTDSSFIICSNHNSHMDSAILIVAAKKHFHEVGLLAATDYWFGPRENKFIHRLMNLVPVDRKRGRCPTFKQTLEISDKFLMANKRALVIFPEGSRSKDGKLQKSFKTGVGVIALALNLPILPVYISGSHKAWPKGSFFMRPGKINVNLGSVIQPSEVLKKTINPTEFKQNIQNYKNETRELTVCIENSILKLNKI